MNTPTVFIIDDDPSVRDSLALLLALNGMRVQVFAGAAGFLKALDPAWRGCALIDVLMPQMGGLELQRALKSRNPKLSVIVMSDQPNVAASRLAFKAGAVDYLAKPLSEVELLEALREGLARAGNDETSRQSSAGSHRAALDSLTRRERQILDQLTDGHSSREVAAHLGISHRTVETYKGRMLKKLSARRLSDLVRLAAAARGAESVS